MTAFTSDSLLSQLLQARASLASGPAAKYQEAYYVFEEARGAQGGREGGGAGVAVSQAALGRWEEAWAAVGEGLESVSCRGFFLCFARPFTTTGPTGERTLAMPGWS